MISDAMLVFLFIFAVAIAAVILVSLGEKLIARIPFFRRIFEKIYNGKDYDGLYVRYDIRRK